MKQNFPGVTLLYSRAVLGMAAEEHGLPAVVPEPVPALGRAVPTLRVRGPHAGLIVLSRHRRHTSRSKGVRSDSATEGRKQRGEIFSPAIGTQFSPRISDFYI